MKSVENVTACVVDFGTFVSIASKLGETMEKVYYHTPIETEYQNVRNCVLGVGLDNVERLDEIFGPEFDSIDLFVFPDIGFGDLQKHLRGMGKAVWGHMGANDLELYRDYFLQVLEKVGLPRIPSKKIVGLTALRKYLSEHENQWVKIDRFRGNMETWRHYNYKQSKRTLDNYEVIFGGAAEYVIFIVQEHLDTDMEVGYDGWCVDGEYPEASFQGYEKKNELYLGSVLAAKDLPDEIKIVNEKMAPVLKGYGYRDWWATEIRIAKGVPYFIDPTPRMPGQTGEHQQETITNFAEIIWAGANGELIKPEFMWKFAAEATLHYDSATRDPTINNEWKTLEPPKKVEKWLKFYHYCKLDGAYHFMAEDTDEVGVVLGVGDDVEEAIEHLNENLKALADLPVHADTMGFADLLESIHEAEEQGVKFGGKVPKPEMILEKD